MSQPEITTRTARIGLRDDGCIVARIHQGVVQSLADARDNLQGAVRSCGDRRRPLLVDISQAQPLEPEVRHLYTGEILVESFLALALVVEATPFGRIMGNIYLRVSKPGIPSRLFAEEPTALRWLRTFLP